MILSWLGVLNCSTALPARVVPLRAPVEGDSSEVELVRAAAAGKRTAQHQLYLRHAPQVRTCVARLLGRSAEADDVLQDAFVAAFIDLPSLGDPARFGPWVRGIAVHQVHRRLRRRRMLQRLGITCPADDVTLAQTADSAAGPFVQTMLAEVDHALSRLSPQLRIAWMLRHVEGHPLQEVAEQCRVSLATVKRQLAQAEDELKRHIDFERVETLLDAKETTP